METIIYASFTVLAVIAIGFQFLAMKTKTQMTSENNPHFKKFQRLFFLVYFMALFSDWLQGPYVYRLYANYGFGNSEIAFLYVIGFASSGIFGTLTGPFADKFGRKKMAIVFCITYSFCCLTKLSPNFYWLLIGRIFGGISTSMLFSTFESWYVYEHTQTHDFPTEWIAVTFSRSTFWNGMLAINAGIFANLFAETLNFGAVSPFMLAIPFLLIACLLIVRYWNENYGNQNTNVKHSCMEGLRTIIFSDSILSLGVVQSLFEGNMYIFVFQWTPILDSAKPPLGMVFACFMICIMIGSSLYSILLSRKFPSESLLLISVLMAIVSMIICVFTTIKGTEYVLISFLSFLLLEVAVGIYFPAIGYLRSQVIPEDLRASIMNWFRLPTNFITCGALLLLHNNTMISSTQTMFIICAIMLSIAFLNNIRFNKLYREQNSTL